MRARMADRDMSHLEAALALVKERGWFVFPCCAWDKPANAPPNKRGKEPLTVNGFKDATQDEAQIRRWWSRDPDANIGVACEASKILVVDVDGIGGAQQLEYGGYDLPETLVSRTGKPNGKHYIYNAGAHGIRNAIKIFGKQADSDGVDLRGVGGYIIAPPSKHYSGKLYEFEDDDMPIADVPLWLIGYQQGRSGDLAEARKLLNRSDEQIADGERNTTMHRIGCVYRRDNGIQDPDLMFALLMTENQRRCNPPLDSKEVRKIAEQAVKILADELDLLTPGWEDAWGKAFAATGDAQLAAQAGALLTKARDKMPDFKPGELAVSLVRHIVPGAPGGTFAATVQFKGREAVLYGVTGDDLNNIDRLRGKCLAEKLLVPRLKNKRWDAILETAMAQCVDIEVPKDTTVAGACAESIMDWVADLSDTSRWSDFPVGADTHRFNHGDGTVSVSKRALRMNVSRHVRDAKRKDLTDALRSLGAEDHRLQNKGNIMTRVKLTSV